MTSRQIYEAVLIEMNKVDAPSLLLEDFNYLFNKAINQYINKRYNIYDVNQQTTDDLRVLKSTAVLTPQKLLNDLESGDVGALDALYGATYKVDLPTDYLHILNCVCIYKCTKKVKCYDQDTYYPFAAQKLTADAWPVVLNNFYQRPSYKRPYFYIHNVNTQDEIPTNPYISGQGLGTGTDVGEENNSFASTCQQLARSIHNTLTSTTRTLTANNGYIYDAAAGQWLRAYVIKESGDTVADWTTEGTRLKDFLVPAGALSEKNSAEITYVPSYYYEIPGACLSSAVLILQNAVRVTEPSGPSLQRTINLTTGSSLDLVEKTQGMRYGNASTVRMEIRYGKDDSIFKLEKVHIDYIKTPQYIRLTPTQLDLTEDTSQIMEFPDYVCQEIINELVHIVMENSGDPRLQTHPVVSQSIAQPTQQQTAMPSA